MQIKVKPKHVVEMMVIVLDEKAEDPPKVLQKVDLNLKLATNTSIALKTCQTGSTNYNYE